MTTEKLLEIFKDTPDRIQSPVKMLEANSEIEIYRGAFLLNYADKSITVNGMLGFKWFPLSGAYFEGTPTIELADLIKLDQPIQLFDLVIDNLSVGEVFISHTNYGDSKTSSYIKGVFSNQAIIGDKSISVERIVFSVPNLKEFHGEVFKVVTETNITSNKGRLKLENDETIITLDKSNSYKELRESLDKKGGYIILYDGELKKKNKSITLDESRDVFYCLDTFLSFLNGRKTSALFTHGYFEDEIKWIDYTDYHVDLNKDVVSWPPRTSIIGLNDIWRNFSLLWKDDDNKNFLSSLIHWYVQANGLAAFSDGSIILAQTALELIYNWWIIEDKQMMTGKDSENISASNKIRLLLSQIGLNHSVPDGFTELKNFVKSNPEIDDAPEAVVQIRNAIVHSQLEKRKKLSAIHLKAKYQALQVCLWYIELSLLRILEYQGIYHNRCSKAKTVSRAEELVPWNKEQKKPAANNH